MICKICGAPMRANQVGLAFGMAATCKCGEIRSRARIKGCPQCGVKGSHKEPYLNLFLVKRLLRTPYYEMRCSACGHKWRVE